MGAAARAVRAGELPIRYWYRSFISESDITKGLNVYRLEDRTVKAKSAKVDFLNSQTLIWESDRGEKKHRRS